MKMLFEPSITLTILNTHRISYYNSHNMDSIIINGEGKNLSGLKFSKLDEDTQSEFLNSELQVYRMTDYTEKDIRETFCRQNAGKALSSKLVRVVFESDEFNDMIYSLANHPTLQATYFIV